VKTLTFQSTEQKHRDVLQSAECAECGMQRNAESVTSAECGM